MPDPDPRSPAILLAWKETGARLDSHPDPALAEDWANVGHLLVWLDGHGDHGGWHFDPATQRLVCACEAELFQVDPVAGEAAS